MKTILAVLAVALLLLAGCVQIPEEAPAAAPDSVFEPVKEGLVEPALNPAANAGEPNPLAPLQQPNKTGNVAPRPRAVNAANTTNSTKQQPNGTTKGGWTTKPIEIQEGETKYVYVRT